MKAFGWSHNTANGMYKMPYQIRTYEGKDEWASNKYIAHMNLGRDIFMSFFGATAEEAETKARNWYNQERDRFKTIDTSEDKPAANDGWTSQPQSLSEHGMIGKVWMIDHANKVRARIDQNEVDSYLAKGYVKAGPKTKFME